MDIFIHKIHMGKNLPSVIAGKPYQIIGNAQSLHDYSNVGYPAIGGAGNCQTCHDPATGATQQDAWLKQPNRNACGSCHDDVNFTTGLNHVNLPQVTDNQCSQCHIPQGELEFDASIIGAHTTPVLSKSIPGIVITITSVANGVAGKAPLVSFTSKDKSGAAVTMAQLTGGSNALRFVMTGPTTDYGATSFGSDVTTPGYVSETANTAGKCDAAGNCTYQFTHSIPAAAKGTFAIGAEARRSATLLPGTLQQQTVNYGAVNPVFYFAVDGSTVTPRRQVVDIAKCQACHVSLQLHGANRNDNVQYCVFCHNPLDTDAALRPSATTPADKTAPAQGVNMAYMVHRIHWGDGMAAAGATYIVVGNGGSHNDFGDVTYPAMGPTGSTGFVQSCYMCHVNGSEAVLPIGKNQVTNPSSPLSPAGATTSACTACHADNSVFAHALSNTDPKFGESCDVCHGTAGEFSTTKVHAVTR
jgi:OmcA/MtrC family decaheme c-type cytochrome